MKKQISILAGIVIVVIAVGFLLARSSGTNTPPAAPDSSQPVDPSVLVKSDSQRIGSADAKVTLVEWGDFQCPACGAYYPIIEQTLQTYKDNPNFSFVFRNYPIAQLHPNATLAAEAGQAAAAQGKFWDMFNKLYQTQNDWANSKDAETMFVRRPSMNGSRAGKSGRVVNGIGKI